MRNAMAIFLAMVLFLSSSCAAASSPAPTQAVTEAPTPSVTPTPTPTEKPAVESIDSLADLEMLADIISVKFVDTYAKYIVQYKIRYKSDDCEVVGYITAPLDYLEKECPIIIYNRGGNQAFGMLYEEEAWGYIVLASQYRGNDGGTGKEQFGGDDVNDVIKLIDIGERFTFAQKGGVYMTGYSRGGMMTYIACRTDDRIKAATVCAGISDSFAMYESRNDIKTVYRSLVGGNPENLPEEYVKRSAVLWADEIDTPLLIMHGGEADKNVDTSQAKSMAEALDEHGKEYKLIIYEDADHDLPGEEWIPEMLDWYAAHPLQ